MDEPDPGLLLINGEADEAAGAEAARMKNGNQVFRTHLSGFPLLTYLNVYVIFNLNNVHRNKQRLN